jgi:hypothetical protein
MSFESQFELLAEKNISLFFTAEIFYMVYKEPTYCNDSSIEFEMRKIRIKFDDAEGTLAIRKHIESESGFINWV